MPNLTKLRNIAIICILAIILFSLTGCSNKNNEENIIEKVDQEIGYLDGKIIEITNRLNNLSFENYKVISEDIKEEKSSSGGNDSSSKNESKDSSNSSSDGSETNGGDVSNKQSSSGEGISSEVDSEKSKIFKMSESLILKNNINQNNDIEWEEIQKDVQNIYTIWPTISLDLAKVGINNNDMLRFNNILDDIAIEAKNNNKETSLENLTNMYALISDFKNYSSESEINKNVMNTKSSILKSYYFVNIDNWEEASKNLKMASDIFTSVVTEKDNYQNKDLNINRANILLQDLKNSINKNDKQVFFVRYKNLLQELNDIIK